MGFAIPAAIGAALARPGTPVLCLTTDGSFGMSCGELETLQRLQLPITVLHLTNGSFGWIKMLQRLYMEKRYFGVDFAHVDADTVAEGFGVHTLRVSSLAELQAAVRESQVAGTPAFIDIAIAAEPDLMAPVPPWRAALAGKAARPVY
jgi:acetolactate synthase-1/2/3 large subunit